MTYQPRLKGLYKEKVVPALMAEFGYKNQMMVPKLEKIVISKGVGSAVADKKQIEYAIDETTRIAGQKAIQCMSKKDVASFKLRKGMPIGVKVTLRADKMYEFLDRLVSASRLVSRMTSTGSTLTVSTDAVTTTWVLPSR